MLVVGFALFGIFQGIVSRGDRNEFLFKARHILAVFCLVGMQLPRQTMIRSFNVTLARAPWNSQDFVKGLTHSEHFSDTSPFSCNTPIRCLAL